MKIYFFKWVKYLSRALGNCNIYNYGYNCFICNWSSNNHRINEINNFIYTVEWLTRVLLKHMVFDTENRWWCAFLRTWLQNLIIVSKLTFSNKLIVYLNSKSTQFQKQFLLKLNKNYYFHIIIHKMYNMLFIVNIMSP